MILINRKIVKTLQGRILLIIIVFLIIPYSVSVYLLNKPLVRIIEQKISESTQQILSLTAISIENVMNDMTDAAISLVYDNQVMDILTNPSEFSLYKRLITIKSILGRVNRGYLKSMNILITLLDFNGNMYTNWAFDKRQYKQISEQVSNILKENEHDLFIWMDIHENFVKYESKQLISLVVRISGGKLNETIGACMISIYEQDLKRILKKSTKFSNSDILIVNEDGKILSHVNEEYIGKGIIEIFDVPFVFKDTIGLKVIEKGGEKQFVNYTLISETNWYLLLIKPYRLVFKEINKIQRIIVYLIFSILSVFVFISYIISRTISKPLKNLSNQMSEIEDIRLSPIIEPEGSEEIVILITAFNRMIVRIKKLLIRIKKDETEKKEMEFKALQAQINPHFIFNTLNNIKMMAYMSDAPEVGNMITALGSLMEKSIGRSNDNLTLSSELEYVENYISLQNIRYQDKILVRYSIPDKLRNCKVIRFIIQPFVENTIYHGYEGFKKEIVIWIEAERNGNELTIRIIDEGKGIENQKLEEIRKSLEEKPYSKISDRIGIKNVHDRIRINFGAQYGVRIHSNCHKGTTILISIPFMNIKGSD